MATRKRVDAPLERCALAAGPQVAQAVRLANGRRGSPEGLRYVDFATCSKYGFVQPSPSTVPACGMYSQPIHPS